MGCHWNEAIFGMHRAYVNPGCLVNAHDVAAIGCTSHTYPALHEAAAIAARHCVPRKARFSRPEKKIIQMHL
jgi:hypothetical protein